MWRAIINGSSHDVDIPVDMEEICGGTMVGFSPNVPMTGNYTFEVRLVINRLMSYWKGLKYDTVTGTNGTPNFSLPLLQTTGPVPKLVDLLKHSESVSLVRCAPQRPYCQRTCAKISGSFSGNIFKPYTCDLVGPESMTVVLKQFKHRILVTCLGDSYMMKICPHLSMGKKGLKTESIKWLWHGSVDALIRNFWSLWITLPPSPSGTFRVLVWNVGSHFAYYHGRHEMPEWFCKIRERLQELHARGMGFYLVIGTETAVVNQQCPPNFLISQ